MGTARGQFEHGGGRCGADEQHRVGPRLDGGRDGAAAAPPAATSSTSSVTSGPATRRASADCGREPGALRRHEGRSGAGQQPVASGSTGAQWRTSTRVGPAAAVDGAHLRPVLAQGISSASARRGPRPSRAAVPRPSPSCAVWRLRRRPRRRRRAASARSPRPPPPIGRATADAGRRVVGEVGDGRPTAFRAHAAAPAVVVGSTGSRSARWRRALASATSPPSWPGRRRSERRSITAGGRLRGPAGRDVQRGPPSTRAAPWARGQTRGVGNGVRCTMLRGSAH